MKFRKPTKILRKKPRTTRLKNILDVDIYNKTINLYKEIKKKQDIDLLLTLKSFFAVMIDAQTDTTVENNRISAIWVTPNNYLGNFVFRNSDFPIQLLREIQNDKHCPFNYKKQRDFGRMI